ncbi:MAG: UxaA family hydrolase [Nitrososphaeria archaeon]
MEILGYDRLNGVGVRNYVAVMATVGCSGDAAERIVQLYPKAKLLVHLQGCAQTPPDIELVEKVLVNLALNPNVYSVLLVSLGCESVDADKVADKISSVKNVEVVRVQERGLSHAISRGLEIVKKMCDEAEKVSRTKVDFSNIKVAIKCGASDSTSGIISNPVAGRVADMIIREGGTVIFGETTEIIGAEHILAKRAVDDNVARRMFAAIEEMEKRAMSMGVDMRGGQPTGGNIKGGITTIEEKSLGAICKTGTSKLVDVIGYGDVPSKRGLVFMDSPGREMEALTGFAAGGAQIILFTTGLGAPQGFPTVPVIKVSGNPEVCARLNEHIDVDLSPVFYGRESLDEAAQRLFNEIIDVATFKRTKAEMLAYEKFFNIYVKGPVI